MYKKVDKNNKVFETAEFQKDKYKFYLAMQIKSGDDPIIYSNGEDYFLIRSDDKHPVWVWTKDNISKELVKEIKDVIKLFLVNDEKDNFTCKKEFYEMLVIDGFDDINKDDYFEMGALHCEKATRPLKKCEANMMVASIEDLGTIAQFWYDDNHETGDFNITMETAHSDAEKMIQKGTTYVYRDTNNKIVSMAAYMNIDGMSRINHVYTPKEERRKGYCANLIYELSSMLIEKRLIPMMYTDYNYIASNKAYMNAGYVKDGILVNFSCSRKF